MNTTLSLEEKVFNKEVMELETYIMFKLKEITAKLAPELIARNRKPIALSMGAPTANPPQFVIDKLTEYLSKPNVHTYSTPKGEIKLRDAISTWMKRRFNVDIDAEKEIFSLIGSKEGIANLIRFSTTPKENEFEKDIILCPDPGYASYSQFVKTSGAKVWPIPLTPGNNYMPDMQSVVDDLVNNGYDKNKIKMIIINYPNNPLGVSATREYVKSVLDFCKKEQILLVSDAAYSELYFREEEKPFSIFEFEGAKDIAIEFFSFSKPYALTGWRVGWVCGNSSVVQRFGKGKSTIDNGIFKALQFACADLMNSPEGDEYIAQSNLDYKRKQHILVQGLKELGWPIDEDKIPHTTFYLWLPIPPRYDNAFKFCEEVLEKSGLVLVPGNAFGDQGEGYFRVSFVCSEEELQEVVDRLKADGFHF